MVFFCGAHHLQASRTLLVKRYPSGVMAGSGSEPESTEESLQAFMEVHQDILSKADEFEPLRQAGAAVRSAPRQTRPSSQEIPPPAPCDPISLYPCRGTLRNPCADPCQGCDISQTFLGGSIHHTRTGWALNNLPFLPPAFVAAPHSSPCLAMCTIGRSDALIAFRPVMCAQITDAFASNPPRLYGELLRCEHAHFGHCALLFLPTQGDTAETHS